MGRYRDFDRRVWVLFFAEMIVSTGFSVVIPFLAIYFYDKLGVAMSLVGLVYLARAMTAAFGAVIGGELADRIGRRRVMLLSMSSQAAVYLLVALAIAGNYDFLFIAALVVVSSIASSLFEPAANAMVADVVEPGRRLEAYGLLRVGGNIGWAAGPAMGGFLAAVSYSSLFLLTAVTGMVSFFMILFWILETGRKGELKSFSLRDITTVRKDRNFTLVCVLSFVLFIAVSQMSSTFSVFANGSLGITEIEIGYLYSLNGALVVLFQLPMAHIVTGRRMSRVLALGALVYTLGYFLVGFSDGFYIMAMCIAIITLGELIVSPSTMNLVASLSPERERGRYMGIFSFFSLTGWSLGPFVGGMLIDTVVGMPVLLWGLLSTFALMAAAGYLLLGRKIPEYADRSLRKPGEA
jgi:MFS family permease